jgi:lipopolysaccharide assembly protein B
MIEVQALLWLLLPVAAASGWWSARHNSAREVGKKPRELSPHYLKGLNYLLNEQPDKAIDVLIKLIDTDSDTVEAYLALGVMFRRRGEVGRAIHIHQNVLARPRLSPQQRALALLELGQDYQRAGLLDRAESLFQELIKADCYSTYAYQQLLDIYQQEHEWEKAIHTAKALEQISGDSQHILVAQYYCELAEQQRARADLEQTLKLARLALQADPACVRASILEGHANLARANLAAAIRAFQRVEQQDNAYLPEIIAPLQTCYTRRGTLEEFAEYLHYLQEKYGGITPMLSLAQIIASCEGEAAATRFVIQQLKTRPSIRGLAHFLELSSTAKGDSPAHETLVLLKEIVAQLLLNRPVYRCCGCGFSARHLYWQCPGCKQWATVKPIQGLEGE